MSAIIINQRQVHPLQSFPAESPYEEAVLQFIRHWHSGQQFFDLNTSGSTGAPKRIRVSRAQMEASARATLQFLKLPEGCPVTVCIDARFIGGIMQLVRALVGNHPLQISTPVSNLIEPLSAYESLGLISLVPLQLYELLDQGAEILNRAEAVLIGGGPLNEKITPQLSAINAAVFHTYGMTETLSHIALKRLNGAFPTEVFEVLPGIRIRTDQRNCLAISGAITAHEEVQTNDLVEIVGTGSFVWKGRMDEVVNSGGIKIFPEEIDKKIASEVWRCYGGSNFFCFGLADDKLGQRLVLFIESSDETVDKKNLLAILKQKLPKFHAPKEVILRKKFRLTASGKIDKKSTALLNEGKD